MKDRYQVEDATKTVLLMVVLWSMASRLATPSSHGTGFKDAGMPVPEVEEADIDLPIEPLWDILLPLVGIGVGVFGVQLTLGLSLAEPLMLLSAPWMLGALREVHESLVDWHLGGLFGHPMLVSQVVVHLAELRSGRPGTSQRRTSAYGAMVGGYGLGAWLGSFLRQAIRSFFPSGEQKLERRAVAALLASFLVACNLWIVWTCGEDFLEGHVHHEEAHLPEIEGGSGARVAGTGAGSSTSPFREAAATFRANSQSMLATSSTSSQPSERTPLVAQPSAVPKAGRDCMTPLQTLGERLQEEAVQREALHRTTKVVDEVMEAFHVLYVCSRLLCARGFCVVALTVYLGPAPTLYVDLLSFTSLKKGFPVSIFEMVGVVSSSVCLPFALLNRFNITEAQCLHNFAFPAAAFSSLAAAGALAKAEEFGFALCMLAAVSMCVLTAFANSIIASLSVASVSGHSAGIALGWGLLMNSLGQVIGTRLGLWVWEKFSWFGVTLVGHCSCLMAWYLIWKHLCSARVEAAVPQPGASDATAGPAAASSQSGAARA